MPIANGAIGRMSVIASPKGGWTPRAAGAGIRGSSGASPLGAQTTRTRTPDAHQLKSRGLGANASRISGVTRDSSGAPLGACIVQLFLTPNDQFVGETTSDGAGAYSFESSYAGPFYVVAYKVGAPDTAGTTVNTITAS